MMPVSILTHQIILYSCLSVSLVGNCALIYLVLHNQSAVMGRYRWLLVIFALTDIATPLLHSFMVPLSTGAPYGLALFSHTVLFWPEHLRLAMNLLLVVLFMEHFILLSFHFLYRYLALCKCYSKSETYFVEQLRTEYNLDILAVPQPGYFSVNFKKFRNNQLVWNWPVLRAIVAVTIPAAFSIVVCFVCIFLILRCFSTNTLKVRFRHLQIQLFHALLFQFSVPMVLVCLPFTLSIGLPLIGLNIGQFAKVLSLAFEFYPAIDPFIVIIVVPRFRRIIIEKLLGLYGQKWRHNEIRERTRLAHYLELIMGRDTTSVADIRKRSERALRWTGAAYA